MKRYNHPVVGELILGHEAFTPADDPGQTLGISTVEPDSPSGERPRLLASWSEPATSDS